MKGKLLLFSFTDKGNSSHPLASKPPRTRTGLDNPGSCYNSALQLRDAA